MSFFRTGHHTMLLATTACALLFLSLFSTVSASQTMTHTNTNGAVQLVISVEGVTTAVPDLMTLNASVITRADTATAAIRQNSADMKRVLDAIKATGIESRDIQTNSLNIQPRYDYRGDQEPKLLGYEARNGVSVRSRKLDSAGALVDTMISAGANELNGPSFGFAELSTLEDRAREVAVKQAMARAKLYAKAAGLQHVSLLSIQEGSAQPPMPQPVMHMKAMEMDYSGAAPVERGESEVRVPITVTFALK